MSSTFYVQYGQDGPIIDSFKAPNWTEAQTVRTTPTWARPGLRIKLIRSLTEAEQAEWDLQHLDLEPHDYGLPACPSLVADLPDPHEVPDHRPLPEPPAVYESRAATAARELVALMGPDERIRLARELMER